LANTSCPRCHQLIDSKAIACPNCHLTLKAYGHQGIPLHRSTDQSYLCDSCTYHADDSCNFPQRPFAKECILYENLQDRKLEQQRQMNEQSLDIIVKNWIQHHQFLLLLMTLLLICLLIALSIP
jgi:hypothetical protein